MKIYLAILTILIAGSISCLTADASDCIGCCSGHGGVVCYNGVTKCADGTSLSQTCINKGCDACLSPCDYSILPNSQSFASSGGIGSVSVTTQSGCTWTLSENLSWVTITSGSSGSGNGTVSYSVAANTDTSSRTGTITIAGKTFTITQSSAITCNYSISSVSESFGASGGTGSVSVTAQSGCTWTVSESLSWVTITSGSSGSGNGTVFYSVAANTDTSSRTGTITIAGKTFTITQSSAITCNYSISSVSESFGASGGTGSVSVTTQNGCSWTVQNNAVSWIIVTSISSEIGNGMVSYSVAANTDTSSRTGTITIAGKIFTVVQSGIPCNYTISPVTESFGASAGTGSLTVTTQNGCGWTAVSNASWIIITSGSNISGNGIIDYSFEANSGIDRTGSINIAGKIFTINQTGILIYGDMNFDQKLNMDDVIYILQVTANIRTNQTVFSDISLSDAIYILKILTGKIENSVDG